MDLKENDPFYVGTYIFNTADISHMKDKTHKT